MTSEEVLLVYAGSSTNKRIDKDGHLIVTYKVKLQDEKKRYTLMISDGNSAILAKYPEGCELPVVLNKTRQTKLGIKASEE